MSKSWKRKQYQRAEGIEKRRKEPKKIPGIKKQGRIWVDEAEEEEKNPEDEDEVWDIYDNLGPIEPEPGPGQSIFSLGVQD